MFSTSHSWYSVPWWIDESFCWKMTDVDCLELLAQELEFVLKSEQGEALELLRRGKDVFCFLPTALFIRCLFIEIVLQVLCNGRWSLLPHLCKKGGIGKQHMTFTSCQNAACSNKLFSLSDRLCFGGKRFDWAKVKFGRLLNRFHTERSWHAYCFSLVSMICPLMQEHFLFWSL